MKTSAILCAVLAGTFGFSSLASARDWQGDHRGHDRDQRVERRHETWGGHRDGHRDSRNNHWDGRAGMQEHRPVYRAPSPVYSQPAYRTHAQRFYRGGYLPHQYRSHAYYVNDWRAYQGLYAPPYGHQWVSVDGEFLLVALTTGLIVNALLN